MLFQRKIFSLSYVILTLQTILQKPQKNFTTNFSNVTVFIMSFFEILRFFLFNSKMGLIYMKNILNCVS